MGGANLPRPQGDWGTPQQASGAVLTVGQNQRNGACGSPHAVLAGMLWLLKCGCGVTNISCIQNSTLD